MTYLLRLDFERVRSNLANATTQPVDEEELLRELARRGVWRHNELWWGATEAALAHFKDGEVLQRLSHGEGAAGA